VTNGEFLLDLAARLALAKLLPHRYVEIMKPNDAERLRDMGEQMLKDEKYPAVRP